MKKIFKPAFSFKRLAMILLFINLILGLAHYFIFASLTNNIINEPLQIKTIGWVLAIGLLSISIGFITSQALSKKTLSFFSWSGYIWMGVFHILFFSCLLSFALTYLLPETITTSAYFSIWPLYTTPLITLWALWKGLQKPKLVHHYISGPSALKGIKLVQISDLHIGLLHLNQAWLQSIVHRIQKVSPDLIAITGDLVEGPFHEVAPLLEPLKELKPHLEKFYITGNHEYIHGSGPWEKRLQELGFTSLHNEHKILKINSADVMIAGVPDRMVNRFDSKIFSRPDQALQSFERVDYKILLAHEPASVHDLKKETCDLILSGHTHGGQIFPFGYLVRLVQPVVKGFKTINAVLVFAHQGTGLWGPPMRWFSQSEIVIITWK